MNRTYRQVWNRRLHALQVASEIARPRGNAASGAGASAIRRHPLALACIAAMALGAFALPALATPCTPSATQVCGTTGTTGANGAGAAGQAGAAGSTIYPKFSNPAVNGGPGGNGLVGANGGNGGNGGPGGTPGSATPNANSVEGGVGGTGGAGNGGAGGAGGYGGKGSDWGYSSTGAFIYGKGGAGGNGAAGGAAGIGGTGGVGGTAVNGSFALTNTGTLAGGAGGTGGSANGGAGGSGGQGGYSPNGANEGFNNSLEGGYPGKAGAGNNGGTGGQGGNGGSAASGTGFALTNGGTLKGGTGGVGGSADGGRSGYYFGGSGQYTLGAHGGNGGHGGAAGNGGAGVSGSGFTLVNSGSVAGGDGGTASNATHGNGYARIFYSATSSVFRAVARFAGKDGTFGAVGYGGAGVVATGGANIVTSGSIAGGRANGGAGAQADAVELSGGGNTLTLEHGYSFTGVVTSAGGDTLALGGTANDSFNLDQLGAEFQGFNNFAKTGTSTWTVTQDADQNTHTNGPWSITGGTLEVASGANPGSGGITVDNTLGQGATLVVDGGATLANHIVVNNGGTLDNAGTLDDATDALAVESDAGSATITNTGLISGTGNTIELFNGGTVTNDGGTITSTGNAGIGGQGATITVSNVNGGTISGGTYGVGLLDGGTVTNAGTIRGNTAVAVTNGTVVNEAGGVITSTASSGQNALFLPGAATVTNDGTINGDVLMDPNYANTVSLGTGSAINGNLNIGTDTGSTLTLTGASGTQDYSQAVTGTTTFNGALVKDDAGTWVLDNDGLANTANVTINAGTLTVGNGTVNGSIGSGAITDDGTLGFLPNASGITFGNTITGDATAMVHLFNGGTLTYTGQSTGPQWMLPGAGTLNLATGASITGGMASSMGGMGGMSMGASAISFMAPGGTVNVAQGASVTGGMGMSGMAGGAGITGEGNDNLNVAGTIAGGMGTGGQADAVDFSGGGNTITLENGYTIGGNVVSTSGTTNGGDTLALGGDTSPSGAFDLSDVVATVPASPAMGTTYYAGFNQLAKTGTSTWVVTGDNSAAPFTGGITVAEGNLQLGTSEAAPATLSAGSGDMVVDSGATLSGFGTVDPALTTIAAGGTLSPGAAGAIGSLTINGPLDLYGNLDVGIDGLNSFGFLNVLGTAAFDATSAFDFAFGNGFGGAANDTFQFFDANAFKGLDLTDFNNFGCSGLASGLTCSLGFNSAGDGLFLALNGPGGSGGTGNPTGPINPGNPGGTGGVHAVPEPSDLGMLGLGLAFLGGLFVFDRRRRVTRAPNAP